MGTWTSSSAIDGSWPLWLSKDAGNVDVWSYSYSASPTAWAGATMPLYDHATALIDLLDAYGLCQRPVVFITHSLGGLLAKRALEISATYDHPLARAVKGIVFLGTPHVGSNLANIFAAIPGTRPTVSVAEIAQHDEELRRLNSWYRENAPRLGVATKVYYETQPICGLTVVDRVSSDPGITGVLPIALLADHITMARPESPDSQVYKGTLKFLQDQLINLAVQKTAAQPSTNLVEAFEELTLLAAAEQLRADFAIGKTDNVIPLSAVIAEMQHRRKERSA